MLVMEYESTIIVPTRVPFFGMIRGIKLQFSRILENAHFGFPVFWKMSSKRIYGMTVLVKNLITLQEIHAL